MIKEFLPSNLAGDLTAFSNDGSCMNRLTEIFAAAQGAVECKLVIKFNTNH